ncbi:hypothetical protein NEF87_003066 [Candidatus Lokiarchaeum ossiferum]|uniref:N-acetyltransferase domain-containing protein n=1 Tax=Candidatus Lokiarchaeum ossiferum TaxID=2951803 RepID=A0ABY6HTE2_9ARCH|nr:hypothetical protein NEF87_003066 [Candidatus Lokiarchaeum sp. B-35]
MAKKSPDNLMFKEITKKNLWAVLKLNVAEEQKKNVAPNSVSIAEAHFSDYAWMRAIYVGETPVGFVMLADPVSGEEGEDEKYNGRYFLWRYMIAKEHQGKGYGKKGLDLLCNYVRSRPNAEYLYSSYEPGEHGPKMFYLKYGFEETGEKIDHEIEIRMKL